MICFVRYGYKPSVLPLLLITGGLRGSGKSLYRARQASRKEGDEREMELLCDREGINKVCVNEYLSFISK